MKKKSHSRGVCQCKKRFVNLCNWLYVIINHATETFYHIVKYWHFGLVDSHKYIQPSISEADIQSTISHIMAIKQQKQNLHLLKSYPTILWGLKKNLYFFFLERHHEILLVMMQHGSVVAIRANPHEYLAARGVSREACVRWWTSQGPLLIPLKLL